MGMLAGKVVEYQCDAQRWNYIANITHFHEPNFYRGQPASQCPKIFLKDGQLSMLPEEAEDNWHMVNEQCVIFMHMNATWTKGFMFGVFKELAEALNVAEQVADVELQYPSVTAAEFPVILHDTKYNLLEDPGANLNGRLVHVKEGPVKDIRSAIRKFEDMHTRRQQGCPLKPVSRHVQDMTRLTLSAEDPMILGILYIAMRNDMPGVQVVFARNKYLGSLQDVQQSGSPSVLVNMIVEPPGLLPFVSEAQLYLDPFLSLKKSQHKTYEITRSKKFNDLLMPIFKPNWKGKVVVAEARAI